VCALGELAASGDSKSPLAAKVWALRGDVELARNKPGRAERSFDRAVSILTARPCRTEVPRQYQQALRAAADACLARGRSRKAERLLGTALREAERNWPPHHFERAYSLIILGDLCSQRGRLSEAGQHYSEALTCLRESRGPSHRDVGEVCHRLGALECTCGNHLRGISFAREALRIHSKELGRNHPDVARDASSLAALLDGAGRPREARELYRRALRIIERFHGPTHLDVAAVLNNMAALEAHNKRSRSEHLYKRALEIKHELLGDDHLEVATTLNNLAVFLKARERYSEAEPLYRQALATFESKLGPGHPHVITCLGNYAELLMKTKRHAQYRELARRLKVLREGLDTLSEEGIVVTATIDPRYACYRIVVRPSPINRFGAFAEEKIPPRRKVIEYTGELIGNRAVNERSFRSKEYFFKVSPQLTCDGAVGGSGAEYINHSCDPNLKTRIIGNRIYYYSAKPIEPGVELTVDYNFDSDAEQVPCHCGVSACRGTVNRVD
jgi:tetratricopeptide (TPR) repeat protein